MADQEQQQSLARIFNIDTIPQPTCMGLSPDHTLCRTLITDQDRTETDRQLRILALTSIFTPRLRETDLFPVAQHLLCPEHRASQFRHLTHIWHRNLHAHLDAQVEGASAAADISTHDDPRPGVYVLGPIVMFVPRPESNIPPFTMRMRLRDPVPAAAPTAEEALEMQRQNHATWTANEAARAANVARNVPILPAADEDDNAEECPICQEVMSPQGLAAEEDLVTCRAQCEKAFHRK